MKDFEKYVETLNIKYIAEYDDPYELHELFSQAIAESDKRIEKLDKLVKNYANQMPSSTSVAKMLRWGEELQDEIYRYKTLIKDRQDIVDPCLEDDYL